MTESIYKIKRYFINSDNEIVWVTHECNGWLGTGLCDRNGVEIYEGDLIKFGDESEIYTVIFDDAAFWLGSNEYFLYHFEPSELEVVGHVAGECEQ